MNRDLCCKAFDTFFAYKGHTFREASLASGLHIYIKGLDVLNNSSETSHDCVLDDDKDIEVTLF